MAIYHSVRELIGSTPMVTLINIEKKENCVAKVVAKLEFRNPGGSVKDRVALNMLTDAMAKGLVNKDTVIIEPTSGNTGIGLACVAASLGMQCIIAGLWRASGADPRRTGDAGRDRQSKGPGHGKQEQLYCRTI